MKLNPFKKKTWSETILELENRAVLVADERVSFVLRCRDLALASEAGEAVAVREMKTLTDKDYELSRRQKTIGDALAAARAGLESERVEAERLAEGARRKAITDVEERIYKMLDQTDAAIKTAGESVAALQAEARRLQSLAPHHGLYRALGRGSGAIFGALKYHGFLGVIQRGNPLFPRQPLSAMKSLSAGVYDELGEAEAAPDAAA